MQIAIGLSHRAGDSRILIRRASFTLSDRDGTIHRLAPYAEVVEAGRILYNAAADRLAPLQTGNTFLDHHVASSAFFPQSGAKTRDEFVELTRGTYFRDTIYFPTPEVGLDGVLTLQFVARGLDEPIQVRFEVPPGRKKKR